MHAGALLQAVEVVLPVVLILALGHVFARARDFSAEQARGLGKLVFWICLPALICRDVARSEPQTLFEPKLAFGLAAVLIIVAVFGYRFARWRKLPERQVGAVAQASFRCNMLYVGLPIVLYHATTGLAESAGKAAQIQAAGLAIVTISVALPVLNIGSVLVFVLPSRHREGQRLSAWRVAAILAANPLVVAGLLGLIFALIPPAAAYIAPRTVLGKTLDLAASAALPLALLSVGAILSPKRVWETWRDTLPVAAIKLVLMPAVGLLVLWQLGVRDIALAVGTILLACPPAAASHAMAVEMGGDEILAGDLVAVATLLSPFTLVGWLVVLQALGA